MDARITKQRLGNLLSYDWLKILVSIAAAVVALVLFFTMVAARPTTGQTFTVYGYLDVTPGADCNALADRLEDENVFSYDILKKNLESFYKNEMAEAAFQARRASREGTVMFLSDYAEEGGKGQLTAFAEGSLDENGNMLFFYDPEKFLSDAQNYLKRFFGEAWRTGELDVAAADAGFDARNGDDRRFRSEEKKAAGRLEERARLELLRKDCDAVLRAFDEGKLSFTYYTAESGRRYCVAIDVSKLRSITKLYYYTDAEGKVSAEKLDLMIFDNGDDLGDLQYDTLSFLRFLVEKYGD